jgi:hypothetical protein
MKYHCQHCRSVINPAIQPLIFVRVSRPRGSNLRGLVLRFCSMACLRHHLGAG